MSTAAPPRPARLGLVLALLAFAQMIIAIDYNIVFVALPEIGAGLDFGSQHLQLVVSAYAVAFGGFLLLGGRAADLFGRRRMFLLGMILFAGSSLLGALAADPWTLVAARAVQGVGAAFVAPATLSLVTTSFREGPERNRALAVWGGAGGAGMVLGSLLGGVLTQAFGWQGVFYVMVVFCAVAVVAAFALLPAAAGASGGGFDLPGAATGTAASLLLVFGLVQGPELGWPSGAVVGSLAAAAVLFGLFVLIESRSRGPLMPLRLFGNRNLSTGTAVCFLFMATFGALAYFLTQFWQAVEGYSALATGLAFILPSASVLVGTVLGGRAATAMGVRRSLLVALAVGLAGTVALALVLDQGASYLVLAGPLLVLSLGQGMVFTLMFAASTTGVDAADQGIGSGIATQGQQIGGAVGLAALIAIAAGSGGADAADPAAYTDGILVALWAIVAGIALTVPVVLNLKAPAEPAAALLDDEEVAFAAERT
ncbi:MFS transporter [Glycomyces endophyticus]|uniref:MFS transporter n=1 Tax=Glycomyces endophyticus TaxID=480996 RepID=A0ABP4SNL5_9ACTN